MLENKIIEDKQDEVINENSQVNNVVVENVSETDATENQEETPLEEVNIISEVETVVIKSDKVKSKSKKNKEKAKAKAKKAKKAKKSKAKKAKIEAKIKEKKSKAKAKKAKKNKKK
jgi:hypothetical protein